MSLNRLLWLGLGIVGCTAVLISGPARAQTKPQVVGEVSYAINYLTPNDKIKVHSVADPKVAGVVCWWSAAQKGGVSGALGMATDPNEASLACRQVGEIKIVEKFAATENIAKASRNWTSFRSMQVVRMCDVVNNTLTYLVYTDACNDDLGILFIPYVRQ